MKLLAILNINENILSSVFIFIEYSELVGDFHFLVMFFVFHCSLFRTFQTIVNSVERIYQ